MFVFARWKWHAVSFIMMFCFYFLHFQQTRVLDNWIEIDRWPKWNAVKYIIENDVWEIWYSQRLPSAAANLSPVFFKNSFNFKIMAVKTRSDDSCCVLPSQPYSISRIYSVVTYLREFAGNSVKCCFLGEMYDLIWN